jgi:methionyl-tRNA formyltransferase
VAIAGVILLTRIAEGAALATMIARRAPGLSINLISSREALLSTFAAAPARLEGVRLVGFFTEIIVPGAILDRFAEEPVNLHPGPPDYPGHYPIECALAENAAAFGVTCHVMTRKVDGGPILAVSRFDLPQHPADGWLRFRTFQAGFRLFEHALPALLKSGPLPRAAGAAWADRRCDQAALDALRAERNG